MSNSMRQVKKIFLVGLRGSKASKPKYYGIQVKNVPTIVAFERKDGAEKCARFLQNFKNANNCLPPLEGDESYVDPKTMIPDKEYSELHVVEKDTSTFADYCTAYNVNTICAINYEAITDKNKTSINFEAFELTNSNNSLTSIDVLESLFKRI